MYLENDRCIDALDRTGQFLHRVSKRGYVWRMKLFGSIRYSWQRFRVKDDTRRGVAICRDAVRLAASE